MMPDNQKMYKCTLKRAIYQTKNMINMLYICKRMCSPVKNKCML